MGAPSCSSLMRPRKKTRVNAEYALLHDGRHLVRFDQVVEVMNRTGHDLPSLYRETSLGGLARIFNANGNPGSTLHRVTGQ